MRPSTVSSTATPTLLGQPESRAARNGQRCRTIIECERRAIGIDRSDLGTVGHVGAGNRLTDNEADRAGDGHGLATRISRRRDRSNAAQRAVFSGGRRIVQRQDAADRPDLIDRIGNVDELPRRAAALRGEKRLLQPRKLRRTEHCAVRVVGASAGFVGICCGLHADVAIGATIGVDEDCIPAPLLSEVKLTGAVRARVRRRIDQTAFFQRLVVLENLLQCLEAAGFVHKRHAAVVCWPFLNEISFFYCGCNRWRSHVRCKAFEAPHAKRDPGIRPTRVRWSQCDCKSLVICLLP